MSLSTLPLSYCTNVHPGVTLDAVIGGLQTHTVPAGQILGKRIAAGLWLANSVVEELVQNPQGVERLREALGAAGLICYTLNAFPFGNFHSERVKDQVYLPDWSDPARLEFTWNAAKVLVQIMPEGVEGSISTVPLGFKGHEKSPTFLQDCSQQLVTLALRLDQLHDETGQVVRLAIEPEPCCILETTPETISFFEILFKMAEEQQALEAVQRHIGVCYDICHQAVEFEDIPASIQQLNQGGIRINKVHITSAIEVKDPSQNGGEALRELEKFVEQRYLHQTFTLAKSGDGTVSRLDLTPEICRQPDGDFVDSQAWRVHFHVPIHRENLGVIGSTRAELLPALRAVSKLLYAPHLEVETYTWGVMPGDLPQTLAEGIACELHETYKILDEIAKG